MPHPGASAMPPSDASEPWLAAMRARVLTFVRRYLPTDDAEDVTQQVMISLSRRFDLLKDCDSVPYAITCARNALRSHLRRVQRRQRAQAEAGALGSPVDTRQRGPCDKSSEVAEAVTSACCALSPALRAVALGMLVDEVPAPVLAETLGVSSVPVRQRLARARRIERGPTPR
jgi:RNA polymerase sigma factor (sigma-70 family)